MAKYKVSCAECGEVTWVSFHHDRGGEIHCPNCGSTETRVTQTMSS